MMVVLVIVEMKTLARIKSSLEEIVSVGNEKLILAQDMRFLARNSAVVLRNVLLVRDAGLRDDELRSLWDQELGAMRQRIATVRSTLVGELKKRGTAMDFSFINRQHGMFSFSGLSDAQVAYLRDKKSIYMVGGGRMNVAGITSKNVDYLCDSIAEAMKSC